MKSFFDFLTTAAVISTVTAVVVTTTTAAAEEVSYTRTKTNIRRSASASAKAKANTSSSSVRRHLMPTGSECSLYLKDTQWEDGHEDNCWSCELSEEQTIGMEDNLDLSQGYVYMLDCIEGITKETIDKTGAISGAAILKTDSMIVEQSSETGEMKLVVLDDATVEVIKLDETDHRHYKARRELRRQQSSGRSGSGEDGSSRNLAAGIGTLTTLVVRVIAPNGAKVASRAELQDDFFDGAVSMKTQYEQCSKDQLTFVPPAQYASTSGIVDVTIDTNPTNGNQGVLQSKAQNEATRLYGRNGRLEPRFTGYDLVIFCQPPGSGSWVAYAYINGYRSFFNDFWCRRVTAQVHEIGTFTLRYVVCGIDVFYLICFDLI